MTASLEKLHEERTANSADFRYLHDDIAALDAMRSQKTLSLNLKAREAERKRLDDERLQRENTWRAAHGVKPVKSLEEIKDDAAAGILLDEASQIAADLAVTAHARIGQAGPHDQAQAVGAHGLAPRRRRTPAQVSAAAACRGPSSPRPVRSTQRRAAAAGLRDRAGAANAPASQLSALYRRYCGIRRWPAAGPAWP